MPSKVAVQKAWVYGRYTGPDVEQAEVASARTHGECHKEVRDPWEDASRQQQS